MKPEGRSGCKEAKSQELCKLEQQLRDESDKGGIVTLAQEVEAELRPTNRRDGGWSDELLEQSRRGTITTTSLKRRKGPEGTARRGNTVVSTGILALS